MPGQNRPVLFDLLLKVGSFARQTHIPILQLNWDGDQKCISHIETASSHPNTFDAAGAVDPIDLMQVHGEKKLFQGLCTRGPQKKLISGEILGNNGIGGLLQGISGIWLKPTTIGHWFDMICE